MPLTLIETNGELKRFRRTVTQFKHQGTFQTPMKNLCPFVRAVVSALDPIPAGRVTIDEVIFEPRGINALLAKHSIPAMKMENTRYMYDWSLESAGELEVEELLFTVLADGVDFAFVPTQNSFMIYADHDEYTTFFSAAKSNLNPIFKTLSTLGLQQKDYHRNF